MKSENTRVRHCIFDERAWGDPAWQFRIPASHEDVAEIVIVIADALRHPDDARHGADAGAVRVGGAVNCLARIHAGLQLPVPEIPLLNCTTAGEIHLLAGEAVSGRVEIPLTKVGSTGEACGSAGADFTVPDVHLTAVTLESNIHYNVQRAFRSFGIQVLQAGVRIARGDRFDAVAVAGVEDVPFGAVARVAGEAIETVPNGTAHGKYNGALVDVDTIPGQVFLPVSADTTAAAFGAIVAFGDSATN